MTQYSNRVTKYVHNAIMLAQEQAQMKRQALIEPEYLFLGILLQAKNQVLNVLKELDVSPLILIAKTSKLLEDKGEAQTEPLQLSPNAKGVLELASKEAARQGCYYLGTEHLALALTADHEGTVAKAIVESGITVDRFRNSILAMQGTRIRSEQEKGEQQLRQRIERLSVTTQLSIVLAFAVGVNVLFFSYVSLMAWIMDYLPILPQTTLLNFTLATIYALLSIPISSYMAVAVHEFGHGIVAILVNFQVKAICIGNINCLRHNDRFIVQTLKNGEIFCASGGSVFAFPNSPQHLRLRHFLFTAGGPIASLAWCLYLGFFVTNVQAFPNTFGLTILMCTMFTFALYALLKSLVPFKTIYESTDMKKMIALIRGKGDILNQLNQQSEYDQLSKYFDMSVTSGLTNTTKLKLTGRLLSSQLLPLFLRSLALSTLFYFIVPLLNLYQVFR